MHNIKPLPDLSDTQYRTYNAIRTLIDFSKLQISYLIDGREWLDVFQSIPVVTDSDNEITAHSSTHMITSYDFGGFVFEMNTGCGVYLEEKEILINEFSQPIFSIKTSNQDYAHIESEELDEDIAKSLLDFISRNISNYKVKDFEITALRNGLLVDLADRLEVAPKHVLATLHKIASKA